MFHFFVYLVEAPIRANTEHIAKGAGDKRGREREAQQQKSTGTSGDLWKGEGCGGVHGGKQDRHYTDFQEGNRKFEGGEFGVD